MESHGIRATPQTAGLTGQSTQEPPGADGLSFISGYIEGKADKDKPPSERKVPSQDWLKFEGGVISSL
jgi:hypothetical protein